MLKNFVKAAGFGLNHVNGEFTSCSFLNKSVTNYVASCGASIRRSFGPDVMQLKGK